MYVSHISSLAVNVPASPTANSTAFLPPYFFYCLNILIPRSLEDCCWNKRMLQQRAVPCLFKKYRERALERCQCCKMYLYYGHFCMLAWIAECFLHRQQPETLKMLCILDNLVLILIYAFHHGGMQLSVAGCSAAASKNIYIRRSNRRNLKDHVYMRRVSYRRKLRVQPYHQGFTCWRTFSVAQA